MNLRKIVCGLLIGVAASGIKDSLTAPVMPYVPYDAPAVVLEQRAEMSESDRFILGRIVAVTENHYRNRADLRLNPEQSFRRFINDTQEIADLVDRFKDSEFGARLSSAGQSCGGFDYTGFFAELRDYFLERSFLVNYGVKDLGSRGLFHGFLVAPVESDLVTGTVINGENVSCRTITIGYPLIGYPSVSYSSSDGLSSLALSLGFRLRESDCIVLMRDDFVRQSLLSLRQSSLEGCADRITDVSMSCFRYVSRQDVGSVAVDLSDQIRRHELAHKYFERHFSGDESKNELFAHLVQASSAIYPQFAFGMLLGPGGHLRSASVELLRYCDSHRLNLRDTSSANLKRIAESYLSDEFFGTE